MLDLCDKNEFAHTFFQECPIYENTIKFARGTVLRFRLSEFLMEVYDGSNTVFFSLRRAGNTAVVPSVIMRGVNVFIIFIHIHRIVSLFFANHLILFNSRWNQT